MNPFTLLPPKVRLWAFLLVSGAGLVMTAVAAGYGGIAQDVPSWVKFGLAVVGSLSTVTNAVAATHVPKATSEHVDPADVGEAANAG